MENEIKFIETNNESTKKAMNDCDMKILDELFDTIFEFYSFM